jgi:hypothetical protein
MHEWRPRRQTGENKTSAINESTFGILLEWAMAFVTDFAPDILSAQEHYLERLSSQPSSDVSPVEVLDLYRDSGMPLPPKPLSVGGRPGNGIGWHVLEYRHRISAKRVACAFLGDRKKSLRVSTDFDQTALEIPITGKFRDEPWISLISVYDVTFAGGGKSKTSAGPLAVHLRTACLIVTAALTGMRPEEVLNLRHGCAAQPIMRPGGSRLHLIRGSVYKGVRRRPDGSPGDPLSAIWATVPVATAAIDVAERLNGGLGRQQGLIFSDSDCVPIRTGTATTYIKSFIDFVNTRLVPLTANKRALTIPTDEDGDISLRRFRRTLAWYLRHRPNGDVTTAIQYQHVSVAVSEGYAGTKASGMPALLLEEDWERRKATIRHLQDMNSNGGGVSGSAAERAITAVHKLPRPLLPSDERRLRKDPALLIYESEASLTLCVYREETALCRKFEQSGKNSAPDLLGCVDGCPNAARTDEHLEALKLQAGAFRKQAETEPIPIAQALVVRARRNEDIISECSKTRLASSAPVQNRLVLPQPDELGTDS